MTTPSLQIRRAEPGDLLQITEIINHYIRTSPAHFSIVPDAPEVVRTQYEQTRGAYPWIVAESGSILGFAKASALNVRAAYDWSVETTVYVHHAHRRKKIGLRLMTRLVELLELQGFRQSIAGVTLPNEASVRLHESLGFVRFATLDAIGYKFDAWHDVGYWQRPLGPGGKTPPGSRRTPEQAWSMLNTR